MPRRHPKPGAQHVAPQGFPGDGGRRGRTPLLPRLTLAELRAAPRAQGSRGARMSAGGSGWWPDSGSGSEWSRPEPGGGRRGAQPHLPALPALPAQAQRAARTCRALQSLLLPPLPAPRAPPDPEPREGPRWDPAREDPDFLGALLGELLPSRFRQFLRQLRALCEEPPPSPTSASQHPREAPELLAPGPRSCSGSPHADLLDQSCCLQKDLQKALLHQMPALGHLRDAQPQCNTVKECSQSHSTQAPKLKAVISHSSSGEGSGSHRRYCPFRVRFADETLRDTAIRYWDRYCTGEQTAGSLRPQKVPA